MCLNYKKKKKKTKKKKTIIEYFENTSLKIVCLPFIAKLAFVYWFRNSALSQEDFLMLFAVCFVVK